MTDFKFSVIYSIKAVLIW